MDDATVPPPAVDTLGMDVDEMRRLGYRVVDAVIERMAARAITPAIEERDASSLLTALGGALPEDPVSTDESMRLLIDTVLRAQQQGDHPRYFARVPGPSSYAAVLGDWLSTGCNAIAASWGGGSGPAAVELIVVDWLRQLLALEKATEGVLVSGGSHANLTALAAVQAVRGPGVAYLTDQAHSSLIKALRALGFEYNNAIRTVDTDGEQRMNSAALARAIADDRRSGRTPLVVIASAGTTNTGATDPLPALADLCEREDLWFHIDGAYGAPAVLTESGRHYLRGMERADSLVIDPHKWLFQPYDIGCLLIRPGMLEKSFTMDPEYLQDVKAQSEVDFRNRGLELTRRARAVKLWFSLRSYGVGTFRRAINRGIELAEYAEAYLRQDDARWEVTSPAQIGIVCFAHRHLNAAEHQLRAKRLSESGFACITTTTVRERRVFRLCIINPLTTEDDIRQTIDRLA